MTELHPSTVGVLPTQFHTQKEQQQQKKKKKKKKKKRKKNCMNFPVGTKWNVMHNA